MRRGDCQAGTTVLPVTFIDEDPLRAVREAAGDAFEGKSIDELREETRERARVDAEAGFERGERALEKDEPSADRDE